MKIKKAFEKYDLFKILFIIVTIVSILTWFIHSGSFDESTLTYVDKGLIRLGFIDFFLTFFYSINYMLLIVVFMLVLGGFYGVISHTKSYSYLIYKIAKKIKGNETIFVLAVSLLLAFFTASSTYIYASLVFIPFLISIMVKLNFNKIKIFCSTFGALFVGMIAPIYANGSANPYGFVNSALEIGIYDGLKWKYIIFIMAYILLMMFTFLKKDPKKVKEEEMYEDKFEPVKITKKHSTIFISIMLVIIGLITIFGYLPWVESFEVTIFDELYSNLMSATVGKTPIFAYLIGSFDPFGSWELDVISIILILGAFITALVNKMGVDGFIASFKYGVKKMVKPILLFIMVHCLFVLAYWSPITPTLINKIIPASSNFNLGKLMIVGFVIALFNIDYGFVAYSYLPYIHSVYASNSVGTMLILNTVYGLCQFILPTSVLLFFALSYLDISYKSYLKNVWKLVVGLFSIMLVLLFLAVYV